MADQLGVGSRERLSPDSDQEDLPESESAATDTRSGDGARSDSADDLLEVDLFSIEPDPSPRSNGSGPEVEPEPKVGTTLVESAGTDLEPRRSTGSEDAAGVGAVLAGVRQRILIPRSRGQLRARKVQRIIRRVDPWSILKLSLILYLCAWIMAMIAAVLLWGVAVNSGTVASLENTIAEILAYEEIRFHGDQLFQIVALGGLIGVFVATAITAIFAVIFNLIGDLTGGVRCTVIEEESTRRIIGRS